MRTLTQQFQEYNQAHPEVYKGFIELALKAKSKGLTHYGTKAIIEVLRYNTSVSENGTKFKINNNITSLFARQAENDYPELINFFEKRKSKFDTL